MSKKKVEEVPSLSKDVIRNTHQRIDHLVVGVLIAYAAAVGIPKLLPKVIALLDRWYDCPKRESIVHVETEKKDHSRLARLTDEHERALYGERGLENYE